MSQSWFVGTRRTYTILDRWFKMLWLIGVYVTGGGCYYRLSRLTVTQNCVGIQSAYNCTHYYYYYSFPCGIVFVRFILKLPTPVRAKLNFVSVYLVHRREKHLFAFRDGRKMSPFMLCLPLKLCLSCWYSQFPSWETSLKPSGVTSKLCSVKFRATFIMPMLQFEFC